MVPGGLQAHAGFSNRGKTTTNEPAIIVAGFVFITAWLAIPIEFSASGKGVQFDSSFSTQRVKGGKGGKENQPDQAFDPLDPLC
jgi:hypothetical protein